MAPNGGHLLVGKTVRLIRLAVDKASRALRDKLPQATQPFEANAEPIYSRVVTKQSTSRIAAIRQSQSRFYSTQRSIDTVRQFSSTAKQASKPPRSSYPSSRTGQRVSQLSSRAPFASTLRPNLTGGTLSRTAGGYGTGAGKIGGRRYFSHTPASPAEVVQNVSQAIRAFWLSGQKAHFNGYDPKTGEKRFRAVSTLQDKARHNLDISRTNAAGSFIDFKVSPTITAIGPLSSVPRCTISNSCDSVSAEFTEANTIANQTLLTTLEVDFSRALKDLAAVMNDLKHLATLGSLPLVLIDNTTLRVRFPGCDRDTVESLCRELNIRRGIVGQDGDFDEKCGAEMAFMFPFAPSSAVSEAEPLKVVFENENQRPTKKQRQTRNVNRENVDWQAMMSPLHSRTDSCSPHPLRSHDSLDLEDAEIVENPWTTSPLSGYSSLHASENGEDDVAMYFQPTTAKQYQFRSTSNRGQQESATGYEGLEGVYRFIEECDRAQARR